MTFPSDKVRTNVLYWSVIFLTFFVSGVVTFGSPDNALHVSALDMAMTLYAWVVVGVILNTAVDAGVTAFFQRNRGNPHED